MEFPNDIQLEVDRLYRSLYGKMVASLLSYFRLSDIALVEDLVQDTFYTAMDSWTTKGLPDDPTAWLYRVCRNKTLNALRRKDVGHSVFQNADTNQSKELTVQRLFLPHQIKDNELRLLFATCHPSLAAKSQIMLTLKICAGFHTTEIAKALNMNTEAVKKNLGRAKLRLREQNLPLKVPYGLQSKERLHTVHQVLYLLFNEGYSASQGTSLIRKELCLEAIRLVKSLLEEDDIRTPDTYALFALMLFNCARMEARTDPEGIAIELENQDRSLWDHEMIGLAVAHFNRARKTNSWSKYHYEAAIASIHCTASSFKETRWQQIVQLYDQLLANNERPVLHLNRCIALFYAGKQKEALSGLQKLTDLHGNHLYHASLGMMLTKMEEHQAAMDAYLDALAVANLEVERRFIKKKIKTLKEFLS